MPETYTGTFVTLEGPEGAGKTTQLKQLSKQLDVLGIDHIVTRDPGGTPLGRQIRRILLNPENPVNPMSELLLYQADRAQHVGEVIMPALKEGKLVLCDRYTDSTMAYQGYARGIDFEIIEDLNKVATGGLRPYLTILFDLESSEGLSRLHPGGHDRLEREAIEFHHKVRDGYHELAKKEPQRWKTIDASKPMTTVQTELRRVLSEQLAGKFDLGDL
ncbi:MAG: dTMP kinase [Candidatus Obscuribacterales bacterium]|nr:dTMP kinase [Cyanobacteria bacterium SZAS LIN-5]RTL38495.1 MAG: dTMP kinase [Candidatus Melainabacteria bacterium]